MILPKIQIRPCQSSARSRPWLWVALRTKSKPGPAHPPSDLTAQPLLLAHGATARWLPRLHQRVAGGRGGGGVGGVLPVPVALSVCNILPLGPHGVAPFLPFGSQFKCHLLQKALSDPLTMLASSLYLLDRIYFLYNTHGPLLIPFVCRGLSCLSLDRKLHEGTLHVLLTTIFSVFSTGPGTQ